MRKPAAGFCLGLLLAGCGGTSPPKAAPQGPLTRATCDGYAARAIQAQDLAAATTLAAQASECYANLRARP